MTPKPRTPTASGISRLLAAAGFERSTSERGGLTGTGFDVTGGPRPGVVWVYWRSRLMQGAANRRPRELTAYAAAIVSAGYATEVAEHRLIVTAKTED